MSEPILIAVIGAVSSFVGTLAGAFIAYRVAIRLENIRKENEENKELRNKFYEGVSEFAKNTNLRKLPGTQLETPNRKRRIFSLIAVFIVVLVVLLLVLLLISEVRQFLIGYILVVPVLWILGCSLFGLLFGVSIYEAIQEN